MQIRKYLCIVKSEPVYNIFATGVLNEFTKVILAECLDVIMTLL